MLRHSSFPKVPTQPSPPITMYKRTADDDSNIIISLACNFKLGIKPTKLHKDPTTIPPSYDHRLHRFSTIHPTHCVFAPLQR